MGRTAPWRVAPLLLHAGLQPGARFALMTVQTFAAIDNCVSTATNREGEAPAEPRRSRLGRSLALPDGALMAQLPLGRTGHAIFARRLLSETGPARHRGGAQGSGRQAGLVHP